MTTDICEDCEFDEESHKIYNGIGRPKITYHNSPCKKFKPRKEDELKCGYSKGEYWSEDCDRCPYKQSKPKEDLK